MFPWYAWLLLAAALVAVLVWRARRPLTEDEVGALVAYLRAHR